MPFGKPFQPGQPRPPNSGRKKGTQSKPRTLRERIERRRALREAALDQLYQNDPKRALELEAQMLRDDVSLMRYEGEGGAEHSGRASDAQIEAKARAVGPITDDECMKAYASMVQGDTDEARIIAARFALSDRDQLPGVLRDCRALRKAVAAGRFRVRAEISLAELLRELAPLGPAQARQGSTTVEPDPWRHAGIPLGDGARLIPATPPQFRERELHADPPHVPPPIDAEPVSPLRASPAREARDPWDDPSVTIVMASRPR